MAAHQALLSLGFSRQEQWSGLPFPSPMHESEKWKWSSSVASDSSRPHGLQPTRLLHPWDFPGKNTGVGCQLTINPHMTLLYSDLSSVSLSYCNSLSPNVIVLNTTCLSIISQYLVSICLTNVKLRSFWSDTIWLYEIMGLCGSNKSGNQFR